MLGIDKDDYSVITGEYAEKLREAIRKREEGELNLEDLIQNEMAKERRKKYRAIWKNKLN